MTILSAILFNIRRLEFATDCPREKIINPEIYKDKIWTSANYLPYIETK